MKPELTFDCGRGKRKFPWPLWWKFDFALQGLNIHHYLSSLYPDSAKTGLINLPLTHSLCYLHLQKKWRARKSPLLHPSHQLKSTLQPMSNIALW